MSSIFPGEIAGPALGMKVEIWDELGMDISTSGGQGELVVTRPFFTMPLTFFGEAGMDGYRNSYFSKFTGVWCHGDFIRRNPTTGGYEVLGRSDGVLNPGGIAQPETTRTTLQPTWAMVTCIEPRILTKHIID